MFGKLTAGPAKVNTIKKQNLNSEWICMPLCRDSISVDSLPTSLTSCRERTSHNVSSQHKRTQLRLVHDAFILFYKTTLWKGREEGAILIVTSHTPISHCASCLVRRAVWDGRHGVFFRFSSVRRLHIQAVSAATSATMIVLHFCYKEHQSTSTFCTFFVIFYFS